VRELSLCWLTQANRFSQSFNEHGFAVEAAEIVRSGKGLDRRQGAECGSGPLKDGWLLNSFSNSGRRRLAVKSLGKGAPMLTGQDEMSLVASVRSARSEALSRMKALTLIPAVAAPG